MTVATPAGIGTAGGRAVEEVIRVVSRSGPGRGRFLAVPTTSAVLLLLVVLHGTGCDGCGNGGGGDDLGADMLDSPVETDAPAEDAPVDSRDAADRDDASDDAMPDDGTVLPDCDLRPPDEVRPGAAPGISCRRISIDRMEVMLVHYGGDGPLVAFLGSTELSWESACAIWVYDRSRRCVSLIDAGSDLPGVEVVIGHPSVHGSLVAYYRYWSLSSEMAHCEIRIADTIEGTNLVVDSNDSAKRPGNMVGCTINSVVLRHPWVVWRDVRQADRYGWNVLALNIETGEKRNLSADPPVTGLPWWGITVSLDGTTALWGPGGPDTRTRLYAADLSTGDRWIQVEAVGRRASPAVTPDWFVWIDERSHPESVNPRSSDVYGFDRRTGEEHALVVAGDSMQGSVVHGFGDWIAYEDQRDGTDVTGDYDREQEIYALHLPTRTEMRITDWPGYETTPHVYVREDGRHGVLLTEEIDYGIGRYRLWDCDLPDLAGGGDAP